MRRFATLALAASLNIACGAASPAARVASTPADDSSRDTAEGSAVRDIPSGNAFVGPFASWEEICGVLAPIDGVEPSDHAPIRHERCSVHETALSEAGPFVAMATYFEGAAFDGNALLGLRTARGWFVEEIPDGEPFGGGLSHHTPSFASFDPTATLLVEGLLRVVSRGSSSSFVPGQGPLGSSSHQWTAARQCGLRDSTPVCGAPSEVWSERCQVSMGGTASSTGPPVGERTCEQTGEDIPR
jgi:hypothetical protein